MNHKNSRRSSGPTRSKGRGKKQRIDVTWGATDHFNVPIPKDEKQRLMALRRYDILDTPPERTFDDIVRVAAHICETPLALIVLIDENRQWFKARLGVGFTETPREIAFCAYTIVKRSLLVIPDNTKDPRFANHPLVTGGPRVRFYAGAPLLTPDNRALGTLCVLDLVPRQLS